MQFKPFSTSCSRDMEMLYVIVSVCVSGGETGKTKSAKSDGISQFMVMG